jgi:hypothetical protein
MTFQTYNSNVPNPPSSPKVDVPLMQRNTISISNLILEDHFGFNNNAGGFHKQVHLNNQSAPGLNGPDSNSDSVLFSNLANGDSWPFWQNTAGIFQILGDVTAGNSALFATNSNYQTLSTPKPSVTGGFTSLPGGIILQYGIATDANLSVNFQINYPIPFTMFVGAITLGPVRPNTTDKVVSIFTGSITLTGFELELSSSDRPSNVCWMAIGV